MTQRNTRLRNGPASRTAELAQRNRRVAMALLAVFLGLTLLVVGFVILRRHG